MIRIKDFRRIEIEVNNAIRKAFEYARKSEKDKNDYYLFLCNATYMEQNKNTNATPYVIEYGVDAMIDEHRLLFLTKYLPSQYSFSQFNTSVSNETLTM